MLLPYAHRDFGALVSHGPHGQVGGACWFAAGCILLVDLGVLKPLMAQTLMHVYPPCRTEAVRRLLEVNEFDLAFCSLL